MQALTAAREALYQKARAMEQQRPAETDPGSADVPAGASSFYPDTSTLAQEQADALARLAETLHHGLEPGTPGEHYQVVVHVDAEVLADQNAPGRSVLEEGTRVSAETSQRLACDARRVVMRHDQDGHLLEVGARTRTIPPALRRALEHRDRGYRFPGCSVRFGEGHHIRHVAHGGPTTLLNLTLLCRRHHPPDGRLLPEVPTPASVPSDPAHTLRAGHSARGISIHPRSSCPGWLGERLDVRWAIDVLHPRALGESPDLGES